MVNNALFTDSGFFSNMVHTPDGQYLFTLDFGNTGGQELSPQDTFQYTKEGAVARISAVERVSATQIRVRTYDPVLDELADADFGLRCHTVTKG